MLFRSTHTLTHTENHMRIQNGTHARTCHAHTVAHCQLREITACSRAGDVLNRQQKGKPCYRRRAAQRYKRPDPCSMLSFTFHVNSSQSGGEERRGKKGDTSKDGMKLDVQVQRSVFCAVLSSSPSSLSMCYSSRSVFSLNSLSLLSLSSSILSLSLSISLSLLSLPPFSFPDCFLSHFCSPLSLLCPLSLLQPPLLYPLSFSLLSPSFYLPPLSFSLSLPLSPLLPLSISL